MKTVKEWEELFSSHELYPRWCRYIKECQTPHRLFIREIKSRMSWKEFIDYSFIWNRTPEGYGLWATFAENEPKFTKLKPEPYYI